MKNVLTGLLVLGLLTGIPLSTAAAPTEEASLYQISVVQSTAKAINYRELRGSVQIDLKGTVLLPYANGSAEIDNNAGTLRIDARFDNLTSPAQFGPEYLTYVFWAISPDGRATNLGELLLKNGKTRMETQTTLQAMSLLVTAEPYFAVSQPSDVVVLDNAIRPNNREKIELVDANFSLLPRGQYTRNMAASDLIPVATNDKTPFSVYQARNAVRISRAAGGDVYAADEFRDAERLLALSEAKKGGKRRRDMTARQAVQSAEASRLIAVKRHAAEALAAEQKKTADRIDVATTQAAAAETARAKSENARISAENDQRKSENERAAAVALAARSAASATSALANAKDATAAAEESRALARLAEGRARDAEGDRQVIRAQLLQQLNAVLQTRDSARGLIVNMPDALFMTGSSNLQPKVRESLARVAGIVSAQIGLKLAIEGHTDNVGTEGSNQLLSERRARAARDYLVSQGVSADAVDSHGFGETVPIASNDTAQGRQSNRRVEIVVSGEVIGDQAMNR